MFAPHRRLVKGERQGVEGSGKDPRAKGVPTPCLPARLVHVPCAKRVRRPEGSPHGARAPTSDAAAREAWRTVDPANTRPGPERLDRHGRFRCRHDGGEKMHARAAPKNSRRV